MQNKAKIIEIASLVRQWAEKHAQRKKTKAFYYREDLGCMCAYASTVLFDVLQKHDINVSFAYSFYHCFVLHEKHVIDITATQFGLQNKVLFDDHSTLLHTSEAKDEFIVKEEFHSLSDIYEKCQPENTKTGYPPTQYFTSRKELRTTLNSALRYVEKHMQTA